MVAVFSSSTDVFWTTRLSQFCPSSLCIGLDMTHCVLLPFDVIDGKLTFSILNVSHLPIRSDVCFIYRQWKRVWLQYSSNFSFVILNPASRCRISILLGPMIGNWPSKWSEYVACGGKVMWKFRWGLSWILVAAMSMSPATPRLGISSKRLCVSLFTSGLW